MEDCDALLLLGCALLRRGIADFGEDLREREVIFRKDIFHARKLLRKKTSQSFPENVELDEIISWVREVIQRNAFTSAQSLMPGNTLISSLTDLNKALESHATRTFEEHFGFKYKSNSPPGQDPNASSPLNVVNNHLFYFQDLKIGDLKETVRTVFFQGLDFPDKYPTIKVDAMKDFVDHLKEILLVDIRSGDWSDTFISQTYSPQDPIVNPVRMNTVVVKFYDRANIAMNNGPVSCTYIFCQAQIWEVLLTERIIIQDIFKMMVNQLPGQVELASNGTNDLLELKDVLATYAKREFASFFKFQFDCRPPDLIPRRKHLSFNELGVFGAYPVAKAEISSWISSLLRRANFPSYARVREDIQYEIMHCTKKFTPNTWSFESKEWTYNSQVRGTSAIKVSTTLVYGLGDMSERGIHIYKPFIYILVASRVVQIDKGC